MRCNQRTVLWLAGMMAIGGTVSGSDPLAALSDDFSSPLTLANWQRVTIVEQWPNEPLESHDIGGTREGWMTLMPRTSSWYEDYRGALLFKEVTGDFIATTRVESRNRAGTGAPGRLYSLGGLMTRAPREITPATWTAGEERYTFLSIGAANQEGTFQFEVKATSNYDELPQYSRLDVYNTECECGDATIRTARLGIYIIQLAQEADGPWRIIFRYRRPDLPPTVQVGMFAYTDWDNVSQYPVTEQNTTTITHVHNQPGVPTQPDLVAQFDYVHYATPNIPAEWAGLDLADPSVISDGELLAILGGSLTPVDPMPEQGWVY